MMEKLLEEQMINNPEKVKSVLNILIESPYFYRSDSEELFMFLRRHRREFSEFYKEYYGWELIVDEKCARVYKEKWYNSAITPGNRMQFSLTHRDECIGFMLLIEFFEHQLEEHSMTVEDKSNLRFVFTDMLEYMTRRFADLFKDRKEKYTGEYIRGNILRGLLPKLLKYRFIREIPKPRGMELSKDQYIYEALPALYHYNSGRLGSSIFEADDSSTEVAEVVNDDTEYYTESESDFSGEDAGVNQIIEELDEDKNA